MISKVFPIPLKPGKQAAAEAVVEQFAPRGPGQEAGTLSFRVYRDPARADYLLFVDGDHSWPPTDMAFPVPGGGRSAAAEILAFFAAHRRE